MSRGPAEEDDDAPIEITPEIIEGTLEADPAGLAPAGVPEAAATDPRADLAFYLEEIASAGGPAAAANTVPLIHEVGHLQETVLGDADAALASYRQAQARDPAFAATLGPLHRIFTARAVPNEIAALLDEALRAAPLSRRDRAELAVERGRILEDRLGHQVDAAASYRAALDDDPLHPAALLALLLLAARTGDRAGIERGLAGLAEAAANPERRAALSVELARFQRGVGGPPIPPSGAASGEEGDPQRALETVRAALAVADPASPPRALLQELGELTRLSSSPRVQTDALDELMRHLPMGAVALEAALRREKAHLLRSVIRDPAAAFAELAAARRLMPKHRLLTSEMVDIADETGRVDLLAGLVSELADEGAAGTPGAGAAAMVLSRFVEALARSGRAVEALTLLGQQGSAALADPAAAAVHIALLAETGDAAGLAEAFEQEGASAFGVAAAHALVRAATLWEIVLADPARAEGLYRRALAVHPGYAPAVDALEEKLRAAARWTDLAQLLEGDLAGAPSPARQRYILQTLVTLHRDRVGDRARALEAQRRLCALDPNDVRAWVGLADLELDVALDDRGPGDAAGAERRRQHAATLQELAKRAGSAPVTAALNAEAARLLAGDGAREEAERLYRAASPDDPTGLASGAQERLLADAPARLDALSSELAAAATRGGETDEARARDRALRYRMAFEHAAARHWKQALASLRPLRDAGDAPARSWSHDLARRSGDAKLMVALLREQEERAALAGEPLTPAPRAAAADLGEALERSGDLSAAQAAFRAALGGPGQGQPAEGEAPAAKDMDAALGLYRTSAAAQPAADFDGMVEALRTIGALSSADPAIAAAAFREADLVDAARGLRLPATPPFVPPSAGGEPTLDGSLLRWMAGLRTGDQRQVSESLMALAARLGADGRASPAAVSLALRAAARARLAGAATAQAVHRSAWGVAPRNATLAHALADLHARGPASTGTPETRSGRATRLGGTEWGGDLANALDLERALDLEANGELAEALGAYGRVLARDAGHIEAMEGVRRVARAGGDEAGEARATARLGALTRVPGRAGALYSEAALLFEKAGRDGDAIALYLKVLEVLPDDDAAFRSLVELLHAAPDQPGHARTLDRALGHRIGRRLGVAADAEMVDLYTQRADNRLRRLDDRTNAAQDWKRILKIDPRDENALRQLATLAIEMRYPADAARLLERYLDVTTDATRAAAARLELADAYEAAQDPANAIRVLQSAVAARPGDGVALERLADLSLRVGDWRGSVEALRALEELVFAPFAKAELYMRIGSLLRDEGYDLPAAAVAFRHAADLDPLGDGTRELARLHESAGDGLGRQQVIEEAIVEARLALDRDPLDLPRLYRLKELLDATLDVGNNREASAVVADLLALLGEAPLPERPPAARGPQAPAGAISGALWSRLAPPAAQGFMAEIWALLADAALQLYSLRPAELGVVRSNRVAASSEPRLGWVEKTAAALGLPGVLLHRTPDGVTPPPGGTVLAVELPGPALVLGPRALGGDGPTVFALAQALALLRQRATPLLRIAPDDLQTLFLAAGVIAGGPGSGPAGDLSSALAEAPGLAVSVAAQAKALAKMLGRKERKALALQASRFGFELIDAHGWQRAVLHAADRFALVVGGDVIAAVRALAQLPPAGPIIASVEALGDNSAVVDLARFALSEDFLALRREVGLARG